MYGRNSDWGPDGAGGWGAALTMVVFWIGAALFTVGIGVVAAGVEIWQRDRLVEDTPTETVRGAAAGRTELQGVGRPLGEPLGRLLADEDCLVSHYQIDRWDDSSPVFNWEPVTRGVVVEPFLLDDGTGTMRVEPDRHTDFTNEDAHRERRVVGADETEPDHIAAYLDAHTGPGIRANSQGEKRRYTELWIPAGAELYLLGGTEPVEASEQNSSGLVMRRDAASDEFIISEQPRGGRSRREKLRHVSWMVGGIAASAAGLYLLLRTGGLWAVMLGLAFAGLALFGPELSRRYGAA